LCALCADRDHGQVGSWLERFGRAWEQRDANLAAALFSDDGCYRETPFDQALRGTEEIRAYWAKLPKAREDIEFTFAILAITDRWGIAHWHGGYTPIDGTTRLELDGILLVSLDDYGRCREFREWSNRRQLPAP
jgi:SnoaL-like domain